MLQSYLLSLGPYAMTAAGCVASLFVFASLKREMQRLRSHLAQYETKAKPEEIPARRVGVEEVAAAAPAAAPVKASLNLSKRSQVIRMSRQGELPENIASSLSLPRGEVELLLKIQRMALSRAASSTT